MTANNTADIYYNGRIYTEGTQKFVEGDYEDEDGAKWLQSFKSIELVGNYSFRNFQIVIENTDFYSRNILIDEMLSQFTKTLTEDQQEDLGYCLDEQRKKDAAWMKTHYKIPNHDFTLGKHIHYEHYYFFNDDGYYIGYEKDGEFVPEIKVVAVPLAPQSEQEQDYQSRVNDWMQICFGPEISKDKIERNHRFLEEALELVQSLGCTQSESHQLVDYVFNREVGVPWQEVGGVMVTLAALCLANDLDMEGNGEMELHRISTPEIINKIRNKQASKPKHSPLPTPAADTVNNTKITTVPALPVQQDSDAWISVEYGKPPIVIEVLGIEIDEFWDTSFTIVRWTGNEWYAPFKTRCITHWQPLPLPPTATDNKQIK